MNSDIKIINLPVSRWREYRDLRLESLKMEPQAFATPFTKALTSPDEEWIGILKNAEKEDKDILLFAEHNGKLIGIVGAYFNKDSKQQGIGNIYGVYVNKAYRDKGIGKKLLEKVLERLQATSKITKAKLTVNLDQSAAKALYEGSGFKIVGKEQFRLGDGLLHEELVLEKDVK